MTGRTARAVTILSCAVIPAADGDEIPKEALRPGVVERKDAKWGLPGKVDLPEGFRIEVVAGMPLVRHPIMGCVDDRGRLFVGDAVGVNWNKAQLEGNPPNRVLMLEDVDGDGVFDKSTVFADQLVFPQGALWLGDSLYVCSAPGLWKLTDKDGDGVAEQRELLVGGFDHTGNAADVHGPWLHANGRLYWCHGRKGHKVVDRSGKVVHEGLASGIWSCQPDGSDVAWHSLGSGDNPVQVDFTPNGDVIGVINLHGINPRHDTVMHWLYGGVYERADQMAAIEGLPRTLDKLPVMHDFGHVAVSGATFWRKSGWGSSSKSAMQYLVTHFNTGRVMRMELTPDGSTWKAEENEFLRINHPDVHPTDVFEDKDGSLIVLDTGGWFRNGCPSSLMAKNDVFGAVYRIRRTGKQEAKLDPAFAVKAEPKLEGDTALIGALHSSDAIEKRAACEAIALSGKASSEVKRALLDLMQGSLDPALEHAALYAGIVTKAVTEEDVKAAKGDLAMRRLWQVFHQTFPESELHLTLAVKHLDAKDEDLAKLAVRIAGGAGAEKDRVLAVVKGWLEKSDAISKARLAAMESVLSVWISEEGSQAILATMLGHANREVRETALRVVVKSRLSAIPESWIRVLNERMDQASAGDLPLLLDAIRSLPGDAFNDRVRKISSDEKHPQSLRLRALAAMKGLAMDDVTFGTLAGVIGNASSSPAARLQAAQMLVYGNPGEERYPTIAPWFRNADPMLLKVMTPFLARAKQPETTRLIAEAIAANPVIGSQQESVYRNALAGKDPAIFEEIIRPALVRADEATEAKRRKLGALADKAKAEGNAKAGKEAFQNGKGACIACHVVGELGRDIGPNLSTIGAIRTERDLLESILFPSNTLARDHETHVFELADGRTVMGLVKSHTADGLVVVDMADNGQTVPHAGIVSDTTLVDSLMPPGLDETLTERELIDLVAWLKSL
jgi:putative membrane-bound dehydrogenase-like protein